MLYYIPLYTLTKLTFKGHKRCCTSLSLRNRLNKTECAIFSLLWFGFSRGTCIDCYQNFYINTFAEKLLVSLFTFTFSFKNTDSFSKKENDIFRTDKQYVTVSGDTTRQNTFQL